MSESKYIDTTPNLYNTNTQNDVTKYGTAVLLVRGVKTFNGVPNNPLQKKRKQWLLFVVSYLQCLPVSRRCDRQHIARKYYCTFISIETTSHK
jgi:hypothetical protein